MVGFSRLAEDQGRVLCKVVDFDRLKKRWFASKSSISELELKDYMNKQKFTWPVYKNNTLVLPNEFFREFLMLTRFIIGGKSEYVQNVEVQQLVHRRILRNDIEKSSSSQGFLAFLNPKREKGVTEEQDVLESLERLNGKLNEEVHDDVAEAIFSCFMDSEVPLINEKSFERGIEKWFGGARRLDFESFLAGLQKSEKNIFGILGIDAESEEDAVKVREREREVFSDILAIPEAYPMEKAEDARARLEKMWSMSSSLTHPQAQAEAYVEGQGETGGLSESEENESDAERVPFVMPSREQAQKMFVNSVRGVEAERNKKLRKVKSREKREQLQRLWERQDKMSKVQAGELEIIQGNNGKTAFIPVLPKRKAPVKPPVDLEKMKTYGRTYQMRGSTMFRRRRKKYDKFTNEWTQVFNGDDLANIFMKQWGVPYMACIDIDRRAFGIQNVQMLIFWDYFGGPGNNLSEEEYLEQLDEVAYHLVRWDYLGKFRAWLNSDDGKKYPDGYMGYAVSFPIKVKESEVASFTRLKETAEARYKKACMTGVPPPMYDRRGRRLPTYWWEEKEHEEKQKKRREDWRRTASDAQLQAADMLEKAETIDFVLDIQERADLDELEKQKKEIQALEKEKEEELEAEKRKQKQKAEAERAVQDSTTPSASPSSSASKDEETIEDARARMERLLNSNAGGDREEGSKTEPGKESAESESEAA